MTRIYRLWMACCLLLVVVGVAQGGGMPAPFPLIKGASWTYRGQLKWTTTAHSVRQAAITWTMEVTDVVHRTPYAAAVIRGFLTDLAWAEPKTPRSDSLLLWDSNARYYLLQGDAVPRILKRLRDQHDRLEGLVDASQQLFAFPLACGQRFGDPALVARPDGWYCWSVEDQGTVALDGITGVRKGEYPSFRLAFRTNPDHQVLQFVPGVGFSAYSYVHHGTVAEAEFKLVATHGI
ncbi:MAG TPA: hypothetical protein VGL77_19345 [Armatimonadota bacterium]